MPTDLISLDEARDALRLSASDSSRDATLVDTYIPAVTAIVEDIVGPVINRTVTHTADGGKGTVFLPSRVVSVTSITDGESSLTVDDYVVDRDAGLIHRGPYDAPALFTAGRGAVTVVYVAGMAATEDEVPAAIKLAARLILAHLWQGDQQGYRPEFGTPDNSESVTSSGYAVPRAAYALLEPLSDNFVSVA